MMGFSVASMLVFFYQVFMLGLMILAAYALILVIKALKIYIKKNGGY